MKNETEAQHQAALFSWASAKEKIHHELAFLHHVPNGATLGGSASERGMRGAMMKAQGVKKGVPDIFLPVKRGEYSGLYIEMKRPSLEPKRAGSKGGISQEQADFIFFLELQGFKCRVCYGWQSAANVIENYLAGLASNCKPC